MRQLTLLQRQKLTLSLFFAVAVGAVFTVATPAFYPWQVVDQKRAQALEQQRNQGRDFHVVDAPRRDRRIPSGVVHADTESTDPGLPRAPSTAPAQSNVSQGVIVSLLTDRSRTGDQGQLDRIIEPSTSTSDTDPDSIDPSDSHKKRRRRRKRKMVNEGWQEFTGRTAREEKAKQQEHSTETIIGENGGQEIRWSNKGNA